MIVGRPVCVFRLLPRVPAGSPLDLPPGTRLVCEWDDDGPATTAVKEGDQASPTDSSELFLRRGGPKGSWEKLPNYQRPRDRGQFMLVLPEGKVEVGFCVGGGSGHVLRIAQARLERRSTLFERVVAAQKAGAVAVVTTCPVTQ